MALNRDFKVKDSLNVGISAFFAAGISEYDSTKVAIDTNGSILSGGRDLGDIIATAADNVPKYDSVYTTTNTNSASWNSTYTTVNANSANWDNALGNSAYTTTNANSANWDTAYTAINTKESKWDSTYTTTNANSANWDTAYTAINTKESKWDSTYTTVNTNSGNWDNTLGESVYTSYNSASATTVNSVAEGNAQGKIAVTSLNGTVTQVDVNNLQTDDSPTFAGVLAGNINVGITNDNTIDTTSGNLTINSATGITTIDDKLTVTGDTTIQGSLSVIGDFTYIDTTVSVTSALNITNAGTGPALIVNQTGAQPIIDFQDDGETSLYVADGGDVGIGTSSPSAKLTVSGTVSAQGDTTIDGLVTINSGINQYTAPSGGPHIESRVFTGSFTGESPTSLSTFVTTNLKSAKYIATIYTTGSRTTFEINTVYNGTAAYGSVYGLVDAQESSLLSDIDVDVSGGTLDLVLTTSSDSSVIVYGTASYS